MIRVRLKKEYPHFYWDSANGVTIKKSDREGVLVEEDNKIVRLALQQGILEIVKEESKIITDIPNKPTIKEVVTIQNSEEIKKVIQDGSLSQKSAN